MNKAFFRLLALFFVLGLVVFLTSSLGARVSGPRTRPAQSLGAPPEPIPGSAIASPLWAKTYGLFYGGPDHSLLEKDFAHDLCSMGEGKLVVAGLAVAVISTDVSTAGAAVLELDRQGGINWKMVCPFEPGSSFSIDPNDVARAQDGGCLVVGEVYESSETHAMAMLLNPDGGIRWIKSYGLSDRDSAAAVAATRDNGYVIAATTHPAAGGSGIWLFKMDQTGTVIWSEVFSTSTVVEVDAVQELPDGKLVVAGNHGDYGYKNSWCCAFVMKLTGAGGLEWLKAYGATPGVNESATAVQSLVTTQDGGFALTGEVALPQARSKTWVCKLNGSGGIVWQRTYNGRRGRSIIQTSDGGYLVSGGDPARAFKLDGKGAVQWAKKYEQSLKAETIVGAFENEGGGYVMLATSQSLRLTPSFYFIPFIVISVDKNGDISPGCPFVKSIVGDVRRTTVKIISDSFSLSSATPSTHALTYVGHGIPSVRIGANVCR